MISVVKDVSGFYVIKLNDHIVHHGREVAVLYTYDKVERTATRHSYGDKAFCDAKAAEHRKMCAANPDVFANTEVYVMSSTEIHPYMIQRMLDTSAWIELWHRAYMLNESEIKAKIEAMLDTEEARALDHFRADYVGPD
jgi:hypothetical protein